VHANDWTATLVDGRVAWRPPGRDRSPDHGSDDPGRVTGGLTNGDHVPLPHVLRTLDELTDRWIDRNPHLRQPPNEEQARAS
jgi:hypothetical protein